jgi:hypothetical protein
MTKTTQVQEDILHHLQKMKRTAAMIEETKEEAEAEAGAEV